MLIFISILLCTSYFCAALIKLKLVVIDTLCLTHTVNVHKNVLFRVTEFQIVFC